MQSNTSQAVLNIINHLISGSIKQSSFGDNISHNIIDSIVTSSVEKLLTDTNKKAFKTNNELNLFLLAEEKNISDMSLHQFNQFVNKSDKLSVLTTILPVKKSLSNGLTTVKKELDGIHEKVDLLENRFNNIHKKIEHTSKEHPYLSYAIEYENWHGIDSLGPENTIVDEINGSNDGEFNLSKLATFTNKIFLDQEKKEKSPQFKISQPAKEKLVATIKSISNLSEAVIKDHVDYILNHKKSCEQIYATRVCCAQHRIIDNFDTAKQSVLNTTKFIDSWFRSNTESIPVSDSISDNISLLKNCSKALIYQMSKLRYEAWSKAVILPNGRVNNDLIEEAKSNGITKDDIRLCLFYNSNKSKTTTLEDLKHVKIGNEERKKSEILKHTVTESFNTSNRIKQALLTTLESYNQELVKDKQYFMNTVNLKALVDTTVNKGSDVKVCFYDLLLKNAKSPMTKIIFDSIKIGYGSISEEHSNRTKQNVLIFALTESLVKIISYNFMK